MRRHLSISPPGVKAWIRNKRQRMPVSEQASPGGWADSMPASRSLPTTAYWRASLRRTARSSDTQPGCARRGYAARSLLRSY